MAALYVAAVVVYLYLGIWRYTIFRAGIDDCIFTQIVNSVFSGFSATPEGSVNHLLIHFSPLLVLAFPFVKIFDGAHGLILLQSLLTAATIIPVWLLAVTRFPRWFAFAVTFVVATYPILSAEAVGDFHELAFVPPIAAGLVCAIDRKAWRLAIAAAASLALVKEDQFVSLAFIGLVTAALGRNDKSMRACGFWIASIGIGGAAFYFGILRPIREAVWRYSRTVDGGKREDVYNGVHLGVE